jgi:hypothetical protein
VLLSFCFCPACNAHLTGLGVDAAQLAARIRQVVRDGLPTASGSAGSATPVEDVLGAEAAALHTVRVSSIARLWEQVLIQAADAGVSRVAFHASAGRWRTGPASTLPIEVLERRSARLIVPCGEDAHGNVARIGRVRRRTESPIAAFVSVLQNSQASPGAVSGEALAEHWRRLLDAGADELHIYHAGLASPARFHVVRDALAHPALARAAAV